MFNVDNLVEMLKWFEYEISLVLSLAIFKCFYLPR